MSKHKKGYIGFAALGFAALCAATLRVFQTATTQFKPRRTVIR
jgi:hypothetical protein